MIPCCSTWNRVAIPRLQVTIWNLVEATTNPPGAQAIGWIPSVQRVAPDRPAKTSAPTIQDVLTILLKERLFSGTIFEEKLTRIIVTFKEKPKSPAHSLRSDHTRKHRPIGLSGLPIYVRKFRDLRSKTTWSSDERELRIPLGSPTRSSVVEWSCWQ